MQNYIKTVRITGKIPILKLQYLMLLQVQKLVKIYHLSKF